MKNNSSFLGWIFIILTLFFGSLFTSSLVMVYKVNTLTIWIIPLLLGIIYVWVAIAQIIAPLWRDYRKPRTQRQLENIRPFYQFMIMLLLVHICLSIALGGVWVYFAKGPEAGIRMGAFGLILLVLPIAYAMFVALKTIK